MPSGLQIRQAIPVDIPVLRALIDASVRRLQVNDYTPAQIESALKTVFGVDSQLIADGTYLLAETIPSLHSGGKKIQSLLLAVAGASARRSTVEIGGRIFRKKIFRKNTVKTIWLIRIQTQRRYVLSLFILTGRGGALAAWCLRPVNRRRWRQDSHALRWELP
jgi:hypothetical protein